MPSGAPGDGLPEDSPPDDLGLGLALPPEAHRLSPEETAAVLAPQIGRLLGERRDWLLSRLYRLDVRERDIKAALATDADAALGLARLIVARHHERRRTRARYRPLPEPYDEELGDMSW